MQSLDTLKGRAGTPNQSFGIWSSDRGSWRWSSSRYTSDGTVGRLRTTGSRPWAREPATSSNWPQKDGI